MNDQPKNPFGFVPQFNFPNLKLAAAVGDVFKHSTQFIDPKVFAAYQNLVNIDYGRFLESTQAIGRSLAKVALPPNLRELDDITAVDVFDFLKDYGIPLTPAPRASIARELIEAGADQARREAVLTDRAIEVAEDCEAVFDGLHADAVAGQYVPFAKEGVAALRQGLPWAAQALFSAIATTVVDRIDFSDFAESEKWKRSRRSNVSKAERRDRGPAPEELGKLALSEYWVAAALWHAYITVDLGEGETLPEHWARNTSVHGLSESHYSRAFAVVSMLFVATVLDFVAKTMEPEAPASDDA